MHMIHKHHIIPKHAGGTDDPSNIIELTVEEHALAHKELYEKYGKMEDYFAWQGLAGLIGKEEIIRATMLEAGKKGNKIHVDRYHSDPVYASEIRKKQSKPKKFTKNYFKPKSDSHRENISKAASMRERIPCSYCERGITKANLKKHETHCKNAK